MLAENPRANSRIDTIVGARLRERRITLKISQSMLGDAVGVSFQQIQKYEKGTNRISAGRLQQIAAELKVTPAWFFEGLESDPSGANTPLPENFSASEIKLIYAIRKCPPGVITHVTALVKTFCGDD